MTTSNTIRLALLCILFSGVESAHAYDNKMSVTTGYFSVTGTNESTSKSAKIAGPGAYELNYRRSITNHFDFSVGYALYLQSAFAGNSIYGLNLGVYYFPLSASGTLESTSEEVNLQITEKLRPFVSVGFVQRNFGGLQTTFVGFSGAVGAEYTLNSTFNLIGLAHYAALSSTSISKATEIAFSLGLVFGF